MKLLALLLALLSGHAHAGCIVGQRVSPNKLGHFAGTAALAFIAVDETRDYWAAAAVGLTAGLARELYKASTPGMSCEWASMAYDLAGLGVGMYADRRWAVAPKPGGGVQVSYVAAF